MLHRPGLPHHPTALVRDSRAGGVDVVHTQSNVAIAITVVVGMRVPVVGELQHRLLGFRPIAQKGEGEAAVWILLAAQQLHPHHFGVKGDGTLQISDPEHGVQHSHGQLTPRKSSSAFWRGAKDHNGTEEGDP